MSETLAPPAATAACLRSSTPRLFALQPHGHCLVLQHLQNWLQYRQRHGGWAAGAVLPPLQRLLVPLPPGVQSCNGAPRSNPVVWPKFVQVMDVIVGLLCYIGFVVWRGRFKIYFARLVLPGVRHRPPAMRLDGHWRLW